MLLATTLQEKGYAVQSAYTGPNGLKLAEQRHRMSCCWTSACQAWTVTKSHGGCGR